MQGRLGLVLHAGFETASASQPAVLVGSQGLSVDVRRRNTADRVRLLGKVRPRWSRRSRRQEAWPTDPLPGRRALELGGGEAALHKDHKYCLSLRRLRGAQGKDCIPSLIENARMGTPAPLLGLFA